MYTATPPRGGWATDLALDETQQMIQDTARRFAEQELLPIAAKIDKTGEFPHKQVRQLADLGFLGMAVPEQWGGAGLDVVSYAIAIEEISAGCASTGVIMSVNNSLVCDPIGRYGSDEHKRRWLTPLAQGKRLGCFALSEPGSGSDAAGMRCTAILDGDHYVINGTKIWTSMAHHATNIYVLVRTDKNVKQQRGISFLLVDMKTPGITFRTIRNIAGHEEFCQVFFDNVRTHKDNLVGKLNEGWTIAKIGRAHV